MGGAKAIIATVTSGPAMQAIAGGLGANGTMMVIGAVGPLTVNSLDLLAKRASVRGWYSGTATQLRRHACVQPEQRNYFDERDFSARRSPGRL